jgi:hypothetical protein
MELAMAIGLTTLAVVTILAIDAIRRSHTHAPKVLDETEH